MSNDPLFDKPDQTSQPLPGDSYLLPQNGHVLKPTDQPKDREAAASVIRRKLDKIYANEPDAQEELAEAEIVTLQHSKHQEYMRELGESGKSLAEIQTAWHHYYVTLPDEEKH